MANVLKMALVESILSLRAQRWSQRRIARELEIDRETVRKYLRQQSCGAKPANVPTGSDGSKPATLLDQPAPDPKPATNLPTGSITAPVGESAGLAGARLAPPGPLSRCEPYREAIVAKLQQDLSATRIWQDLVEAGAELGYDSVRRFIQRLGKSRPLPFRRMESAPGEEAQVDFGTGAPIVTADGKRRKTHVFRVVLSCSRKGYSEATFTQTTDDFLHALENAFAHFGGVPKTLVIDNLKAAVAHPDWFDPELVPKVQAFCRHYGTVILPTRPYTPRHKGKVESGVKYVKNNALKARTFVSLQEEQEHLAQWERTVADLRIHGTTKRQVRKLFDEVERPALLPMPRDRFANFHEAQRKVNRDGHIEVAKAYYSVPPEYLAREVWVRWDARLVRIFNHRFEQIALHVRHEQGRFSTHGPHLAAEKISGLERGAEYLLGKVRAIGPRSHDWAQAMLTARGVEGTRVLQGLLALTKKHASEMLETACETALSHGCYRLRTIRQLLQRKAEKQQPLAFLDEHPLIRPLDHYASVVAQAIHRQDSRSSMSEGFTRHGSGVRRAQQESPDSMNCQGSSTSSTRPRSGYPSPGCTSAEPGSVSPDSSTIVTPSSFQQEHSDE
jgi:transposase